MCILQHDSKRASKVRFLNLIDVNSVVSDFSVCNIVEAVDKVCDSCFTCTCSTDKSHLLAGLGVDGYVVKDLLAFLIGKAQITDLDAFCKFRLDGFALVRDIFAERLGQFVNEAVC